MEYIIISPYGHSCNRKEYECDEIGKFISTDFLTWIVIAINTLANVFCNDRLCTSRFAHHYQPLSVTFSNYQSLSVTISNYQSLSVTISNYQSLSVTISNYQ